MAEVPDFYFLTLLYPSPSASQRERLGERPGSVTCHGSQRSLPQNPAASGSSLGSGAKVLQVVGSKSRLVMRHPHEVTKPLYLRLLNVVQDWCCSYSVSDHIISYFVSLCLVCHSPHSSDTLFCK